MSVTTSVSFQRSVLSACVSSKNKYWLKLFCINGAPEENKSKTTFNKLVIWKGSKMTEETVVEPEKAALTMENGGVVAFLNQKFIHLLFFYVHSVGSKFFILILTFFIGGADQPLW